MELIPAQKQVSQQRTRRLWTKFLAAGPIVAAAAARAAPRVRPERGSLPPSRRHRALGRAGGERRAAESLQRPHGSCRGQHRPRAWPGSSAAGDGGSRTGQHSPGRAALLSTGPAAARGGGGGQLHNNQEKIEHPQSTDAHNLLRGARQLSFPWASTFAIRLSATLPPAPLRCRFLEAQAERCRNSLGLGRSERSLLQVAHVPGGFLVQRVSPGIFLSPEGVTAPYFLVERWGLVYPSAE